MAECGLRHIRKAFVHDELAAQIKRHVLYVGAFRLSLACTAQAIHLTLQTRVCESSVGDIKLAVEKSPSAASFAPFVPLATAGAIRN